MTCLMDVKPFFVKQVQRDLCLCIYHLRFDLFIGALYEYFKQLRASGSCTCNWKNISNTGEFIRTITCPRPEGSSYHPISCVNNTCPTCKDLQLLPSCTCKSSEVPIPQLLVKWERWQTTTYTTKKGEVKEHKDLVKVQTDYEEFVQNFRAYWPKFM